MLPTLVQHLIYPLHEWLCGRSTFADLRLFERTQWLSAAEFRTLQAAKLGQLLRHSAAHCPYYGRLFDEAGIDPATADPLAALQRLPLLNKPTIRANRRDMTWHQVPGGIQESVTGGSTGEPLRFAFCRRRQGFDKAARMRTHRWFGADVGDREVYLWGSPIERRRQDRIKSWRDRLTNELLLSAFDLTPRTMDTYLAAIARFDPVSIFGYPSSLHLLCKHGQTRQRLARPRSLRAVFATGELLDAGQRRQIEDYWGVPVANGYGSREAGFIAHDCPAGSMHVTDENVIVEIVDDQGRPVSTGDCGEIVVTHLDAYAMPLIRYRTGDTGRLVGEPCACGRGLSRVEVVGGRRTDHLVAADGRRMHGLSLIYVLRELDNVARFQIRQQADGAVEVCVVPLGRFGELDRERIVTGIRQRVGEGLPITVKCVPHLAPSPSGKFRYVTSQMAVQEAWV